MKKSDLENIVKSSSLNQLRELDGRPSAKIFRKNVVCYDEISFNYVFVSFDGLDNMNFCFSSVASCLDFYRDITPCSLSVLSDYYNKVSGIREDMYISLVHDYLLI